MVAALASGTASSSRYGAATPRGRRAATLALATGVHLVLASLLLARPDLMPAPAARATLDIFDVPLPPDPPSAVQPRSPATLPASAAPGGSFGRTARAPAPGLPGAATTVEATIVAAAAPAPSRIGIGTSTDFEGLGAAGAVGEADGLGNGRGMGSGDGAGNGAGGTGSGEGGRWTTADWIEKPGPAEWSRVWPADARRYEIRGKVELACVVPQPGTPRACRVVSERPGGIGFGRAALELSRLPNFRIRPVRENAADRGDIEVLVPVVFTPIRSLPRR